MITRRNILKSFGLAGISLTPLGGALAAAARKTEIGVPPLRVVFFVQGNGFYPDHIQPQGIALPPRPQLFEEQSLLNRTFSDALQPLQPYRERITLLHGLSGRITGPPTHSANFGALGCYPARKAAHRETIDAAIADLLPSIFPHVGLGVSERPNDSVIYNISASGPGKALPTQCQPWMAYQRLFAGSVVGNVRKAFDARTNVLDFLLSDVKKLQRQLNAAEREKLEYYLAALESMSRRQGLLVAKFRESSQWQGLNPEHFPRGAGGFAHLEAQFEIAAATLIAGLSNVVTVSSGSGLEFFGIKVDGRDLGFAPGPINLHGVGHGSSFVGQSWKELHIAIQRRHVQSLVNFMQKLAVVPDGQGTVLDNTLIVYLSDQAEGHHPKCYEWPVLLLGDLAGRLRTRGRYLRYPWYGNSGHRTTANLYTTLLHAIGAPRDHFGLHDTGLLDLDQDGPLSELLS